METPPPPYEINNYDDQVNLVITLLTNRQLTYLQYVQLHPRVKKLCQGNYGTYYIEHLSLHNRLLVDLCIIVSAIDKLVNGVDHRFNGTIVKDLNYTGFARIIASPTKLGSAPVLRTE